MRRRLLNGDRMSEDIIVTKEMTIDKDGMISYVLETLNYKIKYMNSLILIRAYGQNLPSTGNYTINNLLFQHEGLEMYNGSDRYQLGLKKPDEVLKNGAIENNARFFIENGILKSSSASTSCLGGPGTVIRLVEIPINAENNVDLTLANW